MGDEASQTEINGRVYAVIDGDLPDTKLAETNVISGIITMNRLLDRKTYQKTLAHELTHAYMFEYGFDQVEWTNESVADFISTNGAAIVCEAAYFTGIKFYERKPKK